ncbi:histidine phosphatase family protein [Alcaligenes ammonioxydans]|uniref:histidine phosphatase family protein n=1 Tax=Alcaligenes TaxID=507 RepID=UPI001F06E3F4|nr:histidine phosphatase family protein [Alcaligenes ammonioxydans]MCH1879461.1 histidine phosphatase family protein [Alcaligenes ammonioxydans]
MSTSICLIRHGETAWNAVRRLQGWQDIALNETGREQARALHSYLSSPAFQQSVDAVISSDLQRAWETAEIACQHWDIAIERLPGLRERGFGKLEGQAWDAAGRHGPDQPDDTVDIDYAVEGGESLRQFQTRVLDCFETLSQTHAGKNLLVFAHGGVIDMVWRKLNQQALNAKRTHAILNTSLNFFNIDEGLNWTCTQWGQLPHLNTALDEQA